MLRAPLAALVLAACAALPGPALAQDATPSPKPTLHPRIAASALPAKSAVNLCDHALLYIWPAGGGLPNRADAPAAQPGERFQLISGKHRYTTDGHGYFQTTIPVPSGMGGTGYYWVSDRCFNLQ